VSIKEARLGDARGGTVDGSAKAGALGVDQGGGATAKASERTKGTTAWVDPIARRRTQSNGKSRIDRMERFVENATPSHCPRGPMRFAFAVLLVTAAGCASTTVLSTQPPGATVQLDGMMLGQTPFTFTETVSVFTKHMLVMRKDGFEDLSATIQPDQWQAGKIVLSILCFVPGLFWSTEYPPAYNFVMVPRGAHATDLPVTYDPDNLVSVR
jgi:hypothetical protein